MTTYQKILNVYAMLRGWINAKMSKYDIAAEFVDGAEYTEGRMVIHDNRLYRCVSYFSGGTWPNPNPYFVESTLEEAVDALIEHGIDDGIEDVVGGLAPRGSIAGTFDENTAYSVDDIVFYGDGIYRCTSQHSAGPWVGTDFAPTTIAEILSMLDEKPDSRDIPFKIANLEGQDELNGFGLFDHSINVISLWDTFSYPYLVLPSYSQGLSRCFKVVVDQYYGSPPSQQNILTRDGENVSFVTPMGNSILPDDASVPAVINFTEIGAHKFMVDWSGVLDPSSSQE